MREVLYRGFHPDEDGNTIITLNNTKIRGEWVYGGIVHQTDYYGNKVNRYFIIDGTTTQDNDIGYEYEVIPETVGQYTGLTDTNDKKIFEGDILKQAEYMCDSRLGIVGYNSTAGVGIGFILYDQYGDRINSDEWDDFEIIGNKWDNPKLLSCIFI